MNKNRPKIETDLAYERDIKTKAILCSDINKLKAYQQRKRLDETIINNTNDINSIKEELSDIKNLLIEILNKENK